ncbi:hypothetical protein B0T21DRAFT_352749 [Apiosordaria backusii]|uniref:Uncharacterized protein n=1 Tax=Apiosordaria backusii TaxID=314023 RepID=A0AA40A7D2_9PEZI|nr:hypothetical protein B0T21DRAFT_352749 [Apiosordaria backusii]
MASSPQMAQSPQEEPEIPKLSDLVADSDPLPDETLKRIPIEFLPYPVKPPGGVFSTTLQRTMQPQLLRRQEAQSGQSFRPSTSRPPRTASPSPQPRRFKKTNTERSMVKTRLPSAISMTGDPPAQGASTDQTRPPSVCVHPRVKALRRSESGYRSG